MEARIVLKERYSKTDPAQLSVAAGRSAGSAACRLVRPLRRGDLWGRCPVVPSVQAEKGGAGYEE